MVGASIAASTFRLTGSNYIATFALSAVPAVIAFLVVTVVRVAADSIKPHFHQHLKLHRNLYGVSSTCVYLWSSQWQVAGTEGGFQTLCLIT